MAAACICAERGYCADVPGDPLACPVCHELGMGDACPGMPAIETPLPLTPLPLIGRERAMIEKVAEKLHAESQRHWDYGQIRETARGNTFELMLADGHVARVDITLDRIISQEAR
jgi:hypothetical protein